MSTIIQPSAGQKPRTGASLSPLMPGASVRQSDQEATIGRLAWL